MDCRIVDSKIVVRDGSLIQSFLTTFVSVKEIHITMEL